MSPLALQPFRFLAFCICLFVLVSPAVAEVNPPPLRFTKADNGVITDSLTGLDWYVGPSHDNNWRQARIGADNFLILY